MSADSFSNIQETLDEYEKQFGESIMVNLARAELARLRTIEEQVNDAIQAVKDWRDNAYPLDIFPEPDMKQVRELLGDKLITLVSASNMRHVTTRVCEMLAAALNESEKT